MFLVCFGWSSIFIPERSKVKKCTRVCQKALRLFSYFQIYNQQGKHERFAEIKDFRRKVGLYGLVKTIFNKKRLEVLAK